jgi:hypothetical protein
VAVDEATGEAKSFAANATPTPPARVPGVAFRRWAVGHAFRPGKRGAGLMDYEGRDDAGLLRHPTSALVVPGVVATHTERLRGATPRVTAERVCRALNRRCASASRRRRGVPGVRHTSEVIRYHQRRNAHAAKSHKKQRHRCVI